VCAHVPVRSGGCRGGCRGRSGDPPLRLNVVPGFAEAELDAARRTGAGAVVICALLPVLAATAAASARIDRRAGLLYAPYLAWSTYAAALNLEIWRRNRS
jgi:TspO/MBR family